MKKTDPLKGLRVSRGAVAKILWRAISDGADSTTLKAICDYIADPASAAAAASAPIDTDIYEEAAAETDRAARRSAAAREAAARRRERRHSQASPVAATPPTPSSPAPPATPSAHDLEIERQIREYVREVNAPFNPAAIRRRWGIT